MQKGHRVYAAFVWLLLLFFVFFFFFFKFFCFCFSLQLLNLYAWNLKPLPYVYPPMGIITVSCRGSVVSRNTQNAVFSFVFPELCFCGHFFKGK